MGISQDYFSWCTGCKYREDRLTRSSENWLDPSVNANTFKLCFWVLAYVAFDPALLDTIKQEIEPAIKTDGMDMPYLLNSSPRTNALFDEVLRLTSCSSAVRNVCSDTVIGNFNFRKGTRLLIPSHELHLDESNFGHNAGEFDAERFLRSKNLSRSPSYGPFGGGTTYCTGRLLARQEVLTFVAAVLCRFEIEPVARDGEVGFPKMEEGKPTLGVAGPIEGSELFVRVKRRMIRE
jgi:cytochrome P450